jgi:mycofactocin precursor
MPENTSALLEETPTPTTETLESEPETEENGEELELVLDDLVFEEITIDGICGVY